MGTPATSGVKNRGRAEAVPAEIYRQIGAFRVVDHSVDHHGRVQRVPSDHGAHQNKEGTRMRKAQTACSA
jgi:hypothetical protein